MIPAGVKDAVILGLGISGIAALRYLQNQGLNVAVSEFRSLEMLTSQEQALVQDLDFETGGHSEDFILTQDMIVPGPGVPLDLPVLQAARSAEIPIIGELGLAAGNISVPVIGVTGSNGKTTVTSLIGALLSDCGYHPFVGGNIGAPLLDALTGSVDYDVLVLELSSFQLDLSGAFRPDIALLLNLSPDHLDRHGSIEEYVRAKQRIFSKQRPNDCTILGGDDPLVMEQAPGIKATVATFGHGRRHQAHIIGDRIALDWCGRQSEFSLTATALNSRVNRLNAAAAILAVRQLDASDSCIRKGLASFVPIEHRMTQVAELDGVIFINDSKATNIGAMAAALESCPPGVVLIAGGRDKQGDFTELRELIKKNVAHMICIGEATNLLQETFGDLVEVETALDMQAAVARSAALAGPGQTVLLAPGCASYDMFADYGARGRAFTRAVQTLVKRK